MRYLIVDDDHLCRKLLGDILAPYAECDFANDGSEAIKAVRKAESEGRPYRLICLDIMMPHCDGHQVLKTIRQDERERGTSLEEGVRIVMTTALSDMASLSASISEGCQSYVSKPINQDILLNEIRDLGVLPTRDAAKEEPTDDGGKPDETDKSMPIERSDDEGRFLIVDDDALCRELLRQILTPFGECDLAVDGREGVDAVRLSLEDKTHYDLVCLDIMMPGMNGHQTLEEIRKIEREYGIGGLDGTKVIMTTALRDSKHCMQSFREGCEYYLTKPIDESKLLSHMHSLDILPASPESATVNL